jgi:hypothetical protein
MYYTKPISSKKITIRTKPNCPTWPK